MFKVLAQGPMDGSYVVARCDTNGEACRKARQYLLGCARVSGLSCWVVNPHGRCVYTVRRTDV